MKDASFFHQQANRCYQLAWQSFDLRVAQKLNLIGNEHAADVPSFIVENRRQGLTKELVNPEVRIAIHSVAGVK